MLLILHHTSSARFSWTGTRPPVKNYGIPFAVHVHAIANECFHQALSVAILMDHKFVGMRPVGCLAHDITVTPGSDNDVAALLVERRGVVLMRMYYSPTFEEPLSSGGV